MCCKNGCACFPVPENGENDADPRALQCEKQVTGLEPVTARYGRRLGTADCRTRENDKYSQNVLMKGFKNMKHAVVMQTDFGTDNLSVSTMKGVCRQICPELDLFDSTHAIRTFDVLAASDALVYTIPFWPEETVFVSVVDPGVGTAEEAGPNPCPPIVIGVGIGGTFDKAALLAKKALMRSTDERNADEFYAELENEMLRKVNALGIGPQGFGGKTTALAVNIEAMPTHIAGLPVAVNINCHVTRHKSAII